MAGPLEEDRWRSLVEDCFRREVGQDAAIPDSAADLLETGVLDSMGWVSFLRSIESATGVSDVGFRLADHPPSLQNILQALTMAHTNVFDATTEGSAVKALSCASVAILSSCSALGSRTISSEEVGRAFGMPEGKLRLRAGIESLSYAADGEDELTLGARAAHKALHNAGCAAHKLDWIIATSETHRGYPSLSALLHSQLLARETCGALDVGGACLGLLNGFAVARGLIASGQARAVVVVTADVHSRLFTPGLVAGEFGGLFGDGASAFLLWGGDRSEAQSSYVMGEFFFGCAGQYAGAIRVADAPDGKLNVHFDGEALSRAAVTRLEKVILDLESRSGIARSSLQGLATHQPNPRLVALLAKQCGLTPDKFPSVARVYGNLGASTCGVALDTLLQSTQAQPPAQAPIFLASLGPGLLYGGGWLSSQRK